MTATTWVGEMTEQYPGCVRAQARGCNGLVLRELKFPLRRMDGKLARFQLTHLWFSAPAECDGAIIPERLEHVLGSSATYWTSAEVERWHTDLFSNVSLF